MMYNAELCSDGMACIRSFMKAGSGIHVELRLLP
jgi:hypothetical protein